MKNEDGIGIELDINNDGLTSGTEEGVFANYGGLINHTYFSNSNWVEDTKDEDEVLVASSKS